MEAQNVESSSLNSAGSPVVMITVAMVCKLVLNTARRFVYPFAPSLSKGLEVPLTAITSLIGVNQATSILGIFFGPVADRFGYKWTMLAGLGMLIVGMPAAGLFPYYHVILITLFLAGLGKSIFDLALQAHVGVTVPFRQRATAIGLIEVSWAGSALVGIPAIGLAIQAWGWRSPFLCMGVMGLLAGMLLYHAVLKDLEGTQQGQRGSKVKGLWTFLGARRTVRGMLVFCLLFSLANDNLFVVYGAWMEKRFHLSIVALGFGTSVIGAAELGGEFLTALIADRLGLKHCSIGGLLLTIFCYFLLPLWGHRVLTALGALFIIFFLFEFTIVTTLSLSTELLPEARATMMAAFFSAAGLGRALGAVIGGHVWLASGLYGTVLVSALSSALALVFFVRGLRHWPCK